MARCLPSNRSMRSVLVKVGLRGGAGLLVAIAAVAQAQAPPASAPQPQGTCQLVRDANGNWVADPACPTSATSPATAPPSAPAAQRFPYPGSDAGSGAAPVAPATPDAPSNPNAPASKRF